MMAYQEVGRYGPLNPRFVWFHYFLNLDAFGVLVFGFQLIFRGLLFPWNWFPTNLALAFDVGAWLLEVSLRNRKKRIVLLIL